MDTKLITKIKEIILNSDFKNWIFDKNTGWSYKKDKVNIYYYEAIHKRDDSHFNIFYDDKRVQLSHAGTECMIQFCEQFIDESFNIDTIFEYENS